MQQCYGAIGLASQMLHHVIEYQVYRGPFITERPIIAHTDATEQTEARRCVLVVRLMLLSTVVYNECGNHTWVLLGLTWGGGVVHAMLHCCQVTLQITWDATGNWQEGCKARSYFKYPSFAEETNTHHSMSAVKSSDYAQLTAESAWVLPQRAEELAVCFSFADVFAKPQCAYT